MLVVCSWYHVALQDKCAKPLLTCRSAGNNCGLWGYISHNIAQWANNQFVWVALAYCKRSASWRNCHCRQRRTKDVLACLCSQHSHWQTLLLMQTTKAPCQAQIKSQLTSLIFAQLCKTLVRTKCISELCRQLRKQYFPYAKWHGKH